LLTLIVGPPFAGAVAGAAEREPLKYKMIPTITRIARMIPTITPIEVPPPSLDSGDELKLTSDIVTFQETFVCARKGAGILLAGFAACKS
jgi:hypothetical protein